VSADAVRLSQALGWESALARSRRSAGKGRLKSVSGSRSGRSMGAKGRKLANGGGQLSKITPRTEVLSTLVGDRPESIPTRG
jgi:hypothetical protein